MKILVANHGSYPRESDGPLPVERDVLERAIVSAVREQEAIGLDLVTDGQVTWSDPFSHLAERLDGVRLAGQAMFPGTELAYREWVVEARIRYRRTLTLDDLRCAQATAGGKVKCVLTGPYTLARLCRITTTTYSSLAALASDFSIALAQEVRELSAAGADVIQVDEPMILRQPEHVRLLRELLETVHTATRNVGQFAVTTYLGDSAAFFAQLNSLPGDVLGVDLCSDKELAETIAAVGCGKILALGIVDGHCVQMEEADSLARLVERVLHHYVHDTIYLQPSCGMGTLPHSIARAKLELLCSTRQRILGQ